MEQIEIIKNKMGPGYTDFRTLHYEMKNEGDGRFTPLETSQYNYWIIEFQSQQLDGRDDRNLQIACALAAISFNVLLGISPHAHQAKIFEYPKTKKAILYLQKE
jgi:hypothetical protein